MSSLVCGSAGARTLAFLTNSASAKEAERTYSLDGAFRHRTVIAGSQDLGRKRSDCYRSSALRKLTFHDSHLVMLQYACMLTGMDTFPHAISSHP